MLQRGLLQSFPLPSPTRHAAFYEDTRQEGALSPVGRGEWEAELLQPKSPQSLSSLGVVGINAMLRGSSGLVLFRLETVDLSRSCQEMSCRIRTTMRCSACHDHLSTALVLNTMPTWQYRTISCGGWSIQSSGCRGWGPRSYNIRCLDSHGKSTTRTCQSPQTGIRSEQNLCGSEGPTRTPRYVMEALA